MPTTPTHRSYILACALAVLSAACESTEPDVASMDTDATLADYDAVESLLTFPEWESFHALSGRTPFSSSPTAFEAIAALDATGSGGGGHAFAAQLSSQLARVAGRSGAPVRAPMISDTYRGATFVYVPDTDQYAVDPEREGAPATGVRFVLYEVDDAGLPVVSEEVGYADLVDDGDGSAEDVVLHLVVVAHERTVLDYRTTLDIGILWSAITVQGFLAGEDGLQLDFDIEARGTQGVEGSTLDVTFDLGIESRSFSISGGVHGVDSGEEGQGDVELTVTHRSHTLQVDMSGVDGVLDGSIHLDGDPFATVSGPADNPTILSADGDPLTLAEMIVVGHVVDVVEDVFDLLEDLVDPVDELVLVGIILR